MILNGSVAAAGLRFIFSSNSDDQTSAGYAIDKVKVYCTENNFTTPVPGIHESNRNDGLLIGTGDTLFFSVPGQFVPQVISVRAHGSLDADLFVRNGALPTPTAFAASSAAPNNPREMVVIPGNSTGQTFFVAVTSRSGKGFFRIWRHPVREKIALKIGTNFVSTSHQRSQWAESARTGARLLFGMTEGQVLIEEINMYDNPNPSYPYSCYCGTSLCDVCLSVFESRSNCSSLGNGLITMSYKDFESPRVYAHEFGHCVAGLSDHYGDHTVDSGIPNVPPKLCHSDDQCGHSIMAIHWPWVNNVCRQSAHGRNVQTGHVCSQVMQPFNSCGGQDAPTSPCPVGLTNRGYGWGELIKHFPALIEPATTPDNYDFDDFVELNQLIVVSHL